jgi:hypothetical protein
MNDASHAIALFQKLFGKQTMFDNKAVAFGPAINDLPGDATISASYSLPGCPDVLLCGHDGRLFDIFEITMFGERGVLHFEDHGQNIIIEGITDEETYGEYKKLWHNRIRLGRANLSLSNVYKAIAENKTPESKVDYINTWWTISQIEKSAANKN